MIKLCNRMMRRRTAVGPLVLESLEARQLLHGVEVGFVSPFNGQASVALNTDVSVVFDFDADPGTVNASTIQLRDPVGNLLPASVSYNAPTRTATLDPNSPLVDVGDFYHATVVGGPSGVREIGTGEDLAEDLDWYFITQSPTYTEDTILSGLFFPTAVEFAPDGRVLVAEKSGIIKVFDNLQDPTPDVFVDIRTNVHNAIDRGLMDIAVHPDFPATPYVYAVYTHDAVIGGTAPLWGMPNEDFDDCPSPPDPNDGGCIASGRLSRFEIDANNNQVGNEVVMIEDWGQQGPTHSLGTVAFGADGYLYVSAGDAGHATSFADYGQQGEASCTDPSNQCAPLNALGDAPSNTVGVAQTPPTAEGGALRAQDLLSRDPADPVTLDGTVIRVDPITGLAAPGNPGIGDPNRAPGEAIDPNAERIIAHGLRNPFRFTFRPNTDEIWLGDVGWAQWEEINVLQSPTDSLVDNFGWPAYEGVGRQNAFDSLDLDLLEGLYANPDPDAYIEPFFTYSHQEEIIPGSGEPTPNASISGIAFSEGGNLPPAYDGALFFADFSRNRIWVMYAGVDGLPDPSTVSEVVADQGKSVDLKVGPNGDLFYISIFDGELRRIRVDGEEKPPVAVASSDVSFGPSPLLVHFDGSASFDPNPGDTISYAWDFNGDSIVDSTAAQPSFTYNNSGVYNVTLTVTDETLQTDTATLLIGVDKSPPVPVIDTPLPGGTYSVGQLVNFAGHADDAEDGLLPASALDWNVILLHCPGGICHEHFVTGSSGVDNGSLNYLDHELPAGIEIRLTATDSDGLQATTSLVLDPQIVQINLASIPAGLDLTINSVSGAAPVGESVMVSGNNSVSASSPQTVGGVQYVFQSWSDGGAASHNISAGIADETLTAVFVAVPTDTTDSLTGTISSRGDNPPGRTDDMAFDNTASTKWVDFSPNPNLASWIQYRYGGGKQFVVTTYTLTSANDAPSRDPLDWDLLGSNDGGANWTVVDSRTNEDFPNRLQKRSFNVASPDAYNVYRLDIHSAAQPEVANAVQLGEIELIGVPGGLASPPVLILPSAEPNYVPGSAPVLIDAAATVTDSDSANFNGGSLSVSVVGGGQVSDVLSIVAGGNVTLNGANVQVSGVVVGTFAGGSNGNDLVITFNGNSTPTRVQQVLRRIAYASSSPTPSGSSRAIDFTLTDAAAGVAFPVQQTVRIMASVSDPRLTTDVVSGVTDAWTTVTLNESYTSMVVVATPNYDKTSAPLVTRIRNAGGNSFDVRVQRVDGAPGPVAPVDVYYVVVEEGVYDVATHGVKLEAAKFNSTLTDGKTAGYVGESASYGNAYTTPVVIGQVMTQNDSAFSVFWARGDDRTIEPTAADLFVGKHVASDTNTTRAAETLGYIVFEAGSGTIGSLEYTAGVGPDTVQGVVQASPYVYAINGPANPVSGIVSLGGIDGVDGAWPVLYGANPVRSTVLNLAVDEDQIDDAERNHTTEVLSYVVFGSTAPSEPGPNLRTDVVSGVTGAWTTVTLDRSFDSMVVVATPNYDGTSPPLVTRIRNASGDRFDVRVQRADGLTGAVGPVDVYYVVAEEGTYDAATYGIKLEAVKFNSTATDGKAAGYNGQARAYTQSYTNPVVLGQVMTQNDVDFSVFWSRGPGKADAPDAANLYVGKHVGEDSDLTRLDETIGYFVIEAGSGITGSFEFVAGLGGDTLQGAVQAAPYTYSVSGPTTPLTAVVSQAAMDGADGSWAVLYGSNPFDAGSLRLAVDEDTLGDGERNHTTEQAAYFLLGELTLT